jgi:serine/threonine-protein kinase SRPK3
MKVLSAECYGAGTDIFELEILQHLRKADPYHPGYKYISVLEDSFTHEGPNGSHVCLIFKVMGESLSTFRYWFTNHQIVSPVAARFTTQLLQALDYAHTCGVIHTGMSLCLVDIDTNTNFHG